MIGGLARTRLRETPEFADAKRRVKNILEKANLDISKLEENPLWNQKVSIKTSLALFCIQCAGPVCFYFIYVHCGNILKNSFNYTPAQIIHQNFLVSIVHVASYIIITYLSYYIYPLIILRVKAIIFGIFILLFPYLLNYSTSGFDILLIQSFIVLFRFCDTPAMPIFYRHFPVFKRFTYTSFIYALSRAMMYVLTSFGLIYLTEFFGHWGMLVIMIPISIGFMFGLNHFEKLDKTEIDFNQKIGLSIA
ncbi:MFS transporter [Candidatus Rickettsia colombianensi]|uniref:hypothetical protein n=1 Tax=Candidatus Rickettsia colombianensi TaxID=1090944 RepID=UPI001FE2C9E1|nr:hypothetical protein [Candidatus Rickettsia colombianensi]